jgi:hypothetical protein
LSFLQLGLGLGAGTTATGTGVITGLGWVAAVPELATGTSGPSVPIHPTTASTAATEAPRRAIKVIFGSAASVTPAPRMQLISSD